jgi:hypothetical protein
MAAGDPVERRLDRTARHVLGPVSQVSSLSAQRIPPSKWARKTGSLDQMSSRCPSDE